MFYFSIFSLVFLSIKKIYQTLNVTTFPQTPRNFVKNTLLGLSFLSVYANEVMYGVIPYLLE